MRRLIVEEPVSRAAVWGRRMAWFSFPVLLSGVFLVRKGGDDLTPGLAVISAAVLLALLALQFSLIAFIQIWSKGRRGLRFAISAFIMCIVVLAMPIAFGARLLVMPYYADLSTDLVNPPTFSSSTAALTARNGLVPHQKSSNIFQGLIDEELKRRIPAVQQFIESLPVSAAKVQQIQRQWHPDLETLNVDMSPAEAFARAKTAAQQEGWTIIDSVPPGGRFGIGHLDAVKYSRILKLPIDITVRLRPHADGTAIDVRFIPRYKIFDVGGGPRHIERYLGYFSPDRASGS